MEKTMNPDEFERLKSEVDAEYLAKFKERSTAYLFSLTGYASVRPLLRVYFDLTFTSTFLGKISFDQNFTSTCTSRPTISPDLTKGRSTEVEVSESKYVSRST